VNKGFSLWAEIDAESRRIFLTFDQRHIYLLLLYVSEPNTSWSPEDCIAYHTDKTAHAQQGELTPKVVQNKMVALGVNIWGAAWRTPKS
jgi:hypothetical protein